MGPCSKWSGVVFVRRTPDSGCLACTAGLKMATFSPFTASLTIGSMADSFRPSFTGAVITYRNNSPTSSAFAAVATPCLRSMLAAGAKGSPSPAKAPRHHGPHRAFRHRTCLRPCLRPIPSLASCRPCRPSFRRIPLSARRGRQSPPADSPCARTPRHVPPGLAHTCGDAGKRASRASRTAVPINSG